MTTPPGSSTTGGKSHAGPDRPATPIPWNRGYKEGNGAAAALVVLQIVFVFAPFMNSLFDSTPIGAVEWGLVLVFAVGVFVLAEAAKAMARALRLP